MEWWLLVEVVVNGVVGGGIVEITKVWISLPSGILSGGFGSTKAPESAFSVAKSSLWDRSEL